MEYSISVKTLKAYAQIEGFYLYAGATGSADGGKHASQVVEHITYKTDRSGYSYYTYMYVYRSYSWADTIGSPTWCTVYTIYGNHDFIKSYWIAAYYAYTPAVYQYIAPKYYNPIHYVYQIV